MTIEFDSLFDTENCNDSLTIYDGINSSAPLLLRACGQTAPSWIRSTSPVVFVVFHSDEKINGAGFAFKYTIGKASIIPAIYCRMDVGFYSI